MDDFWDVEDMEELNAERVDAVAGPASGIRFLLMKAAGPGTDLAKAARMLAREDPGRARAVQAQVQKMQRVIGDERAARRHRADDPVTKAIRSAVDDWRSPQRRS